MGQVTVVMGTISGSGGPAGRWQAYTINQSGARTEGDNGHSNGFGVTIDDSTPPNGTITFPDAASDGSVGVLTVYASYVGAAGPDWFLQYEGGIDFEIGPPAAGPNPLSCPAIR